MAKDVMEWTKKELLSLPHKDWATFGYYHSILIVPTRKLHDSGWRLICLVGCDEHYEPKEIIGYCDDIHWCCNHELRFCDIQTDMIPKTNIVRMHSNKFRFKVGDVCSSVEILIV